MKKEKRRTLPGERTALINIEMHANIDKSFDDAPLPKCYGDYSGGVICLTCDLRMPCARLTEGGRERL